MICLVVSLSHSKRNLPQSSQRRLGDGDFFVGAEDFAHGVADFAEGGVGFYSVEDVRHQIFGALGGLAQGAQASRDLVARALGA